MLRTMQEATCLMSLRELRLEEFAHGPVDDSDIDYSDPEEFFRGAKRARVGGDGDFTFAFPSDAYEDRVRQQLVASVATGSTQSAQRSCNSNNISCNPAFPSSIVPPTPVNTPEETTEERDIRWQRHDYCKELIAVNTVEVVSVHSPDGEVELRHVIPLPSVMPEIIVIDDDEPELPLEEALDLSTASTVFIDDSDR